MNKLGMLLPAALITILLLIGCATTLPTGELPEHPAPAAEPQIHVTPLLYEGELSSLHLADGLDDIDLATQSRVFRTFSLKYAGEFPELQLLFADTLGELTGLWWGDQEIDHSRMLQLLGDGAERQDWLLCLDSLHIAPVKIGFLKWLGHAIMLNVDKLPQWSVVISARLIDLEQPGVVHRFRLVEVDEPDRFSTVFDDRLAYTMKEAARELINYLRDWRRS